MLVDPCGIQETVPLWIGGRTPRSLRRAVELADGWVPFGLSTAEQAAMLERARDTDAWARRQAATELPPFDIVMAAGRLLAPDEEPEAAAATLAELEAAGATMVNLGFRNRSPQHYIEQLEAMAEIAGTSAR
jgi:alkanesulfonate monooxygenase SsuD/methylene tetrahydromethanopterin reductase-like flavin-dependent oxidoreductase (luciferase family)